MLICLLSVLIQCTSTLAYSFPMLLMSSYFSRWLYRARDRVDSSTANIYSVAFVVGVKMVLRVFFYIRQIWLHTSPSERVDIFSWFRESWIRNDKAWLYISSLFFLLFGVRRKGWRQWCRLFSSRTILKVERIQVLLFVSHFMVHRLTSSRDRLTRMIHRYRNCLQI